MIRLLPPLLDTTPLDTTAHLLAAGVPVLQAQAERLQQLLDRTWRDEFGHTHCPTCGGGLTTSVPWASIQLCTCVMAAIA